MFCINIPGLMRDWKIKLSFLFLKVGPRRDEETRASSAGSSCR